MQKLLFMNNEIDESIDLLDDLLCAGEFEKCDLIFQTVEPKDMSTLLIVTYLGITSCATKKLPSRIDFYNRSLQEVTERKGEKYANRLLTKYKGE